LPDLANLDYVERVNRVLDHVQRHIGEPLRLEDLARVACFSPYHFHRVFKALVGEPLNAFIKRLRLERAVYLLAHGDSPSLTDVAFACGFSSSSDFSRSFRKHFGVPPSVFDVDSFRRSQRARLQESLAPPGERRLERLPAGENPDGFVARLREAPARRVAYVRVWRPFEGSRVMETAARLVDWATERGLAGGQWLGYMWEDPEIVDLEKCRYDVAVEVPDDFRAQGEVGVMDFPAMTLAEVAIAGPIELEQRAIDWLYGTWLPRSGRLPDLQPGFEAWNGLPFEHGESHFEIRVQLAVATHGT
jgi:AraC family transcriptional regulator